MLVVSYLHISDHDTEVVSHRPGEEGAATIARGAEKQQRKHLMIIITSMIVLMMMINKDNEEELLHYCHFY